MATFNRAGRTSESLVALLAAVRQTGYRFVTPTPLTIERVRRRDPRRQARDLRDVFGWNLPFAADLLPPDIRAAADAADVLRPAPDAAGLVCSAVRLSTLRDALFAHSAFPTSDADSVFFGPDTYRFARAIAHWHATERGHAERWHATERAVVTRAVDIGCGAGPGAVTVAQLWPQAEVHGVDINPAALRLARANGQAAGVAVAWAESDLLGALPGEFDLIVANPPYLVDPGERRYRHGGGSFGEALSLKILDGARDRLRPGGTLLLYTGAAVVDGADQFREQAATRLAAPRSGQNSATWTYDEIDPDVFGEELEAGAYRRADRIAAVLLTLVSH